MTTDVVDLSAARQRHLALQECPGCHAELSVRASHHPSGAWLLLCGACEWHQVIRPAGLDDAWTPDPRSGELHRGAGHRDLADPAPDGVPTVDLRP